MLIKNILVSSTAIPSDKIGSWNVLLTNLLKKDASFFDQIICPNPSHKIINVNILAENNKFSTFLFTKFDKFYTKKIYWQKLKKYIKGNEIINVVIFDDVKILQAINHYARQDKTRKNLNIIYFIRGFRFDVNLTNRNQIYNCIDKLIIQTETSYIKQVEENHTIPCEVEILRNGINSNVFYPFSIEKKDDLRKKLNFKKNIKYFLWISQDRPKKGLSIILKAWEKITKNNNDVELLIIGTHIEIKGKQITWLGRKKNEELAVYYQSTDYYLFSSLCHEGHPLSLTEALKSGAKCLASDIDPISEVLHNGDLGYLVKNPHFVKNWVYAIEDVLNKEINFNKKNIDLSKLYDENEWIASFKEILNKN
ncbi:glycosyltransferase family 4 protein [Rosistilla oblonga]|uniref:glycosyltransferase family 4 protein n=1 Tax=Rosistilla oblonga TaxID=2527990 RepID=UPI003A96F4A4